MELEPHQIVAAALDDRELYTKLQDLILSQNKEVGKPWDGCFGASPIGGIAWQNGWDPNSRVLVSVLLCIGLAHDRWPEEIRKTAKAAALYAIRAEIAQNRLPHTYTNVSISMAAACFYLAVHLFDTDLGNYSLNLIEEITSDRAQRGGFFEFGSPTYLGLSLLSASFLEQLMGRYLTLVDQLTSDIANCWSTDIQDLVGTSMRTYGPSIYTHFSLSMLALGPHIGKELDEPLLHVEDTTFRTAFELVKPFDPARVTVSRKTTNTISQVATITRNKAGKPFHLEVSNFTEGVWHHQATSASVHTKGGALILRHPSIEAKVINDSIEWSPKTIQEDGNPLWLWGGLSRPDMGTRCTNPLIITEGWNVKRLDKSHIQVGGITFMITSPFSLDESALRLQSTEGSLTAV